MRHKDIGDKISVLYHHFLVNCTNTREFCYLAYGQMDKQKPFKKTQRPLLCTHGHACAHVYM